MVDEDFLVHSISQEHFLLQHLRYFLEFFGWDNFHPLFQGLPLPERHEEVVLADFVECLDFLKPLLNRDELDRFGGDELADSLAAERVIVLYFIFNNLWIWDHLHIIMIVGVLSHHINKFVSSQLFLSYHFEERGHLCVVYWIACLFGIFFWHRWRYCFHFYRR